MQRVADTSAVPDLVFSEMKFLQKEKNQQESAPQQSAPKKKRKKDHAHTKEGEISAFFTAIRPALAEKDGNVQSQDARGDGSVSAVPSRRERERSAKSTGVVPTIEVHDKGPYLGFGSRGPRHESTSYVSWSDSVRGPEVTPRHPEQVRAVNKEHHVSKHQRASTTTGGDDDVFKHPAPRSATHVTHDSAEHFVVSSVDRSDSYPRASRSHSYPQHTSSPRKVNLVDRAAKISSTDPADSPSSMPPSIPSRAVGEPRHRNYTVGPKPARHGQPGPLHPRVTSMHRKSVERSGDGQTEDEMQTSSDLGKVIQQCNDTFHERRRATAPRRRHTVLPEAPMENERIERGRNSGVHRTRHVRFSGLDIPSPVVPNFSGPSIYEQQAHRQTLPLPDFDQEDEVDGVSHLTEQEYIDDPNGMLYGERNWEEYSGEPASYDMGLEAQGYGVEELPPSEHMVQHLASENSIVAPGFWRPNKLY